MLQMPKPGTQTYQQRVDRFKNLLNQSTTLHRAKGPYIAEQNQPPVSPAKTPRIPPGFYSAN